MTEASEVELSGRPALLLPERALFLPEEGALVVSDLHLGKGAAFRSRGIPIPAGSSREDLRRLGDLLRESGARRLLILGDLLHAAAGRSPELLQALARWRGEHPEVEVVLVRGNHDRRAGDPPGALGIRCVDGPWREGDLAFAHEPSGEPGRDHIYLLVGHLHPAVVLRGPGGRLRLPCFWLGPRVGVLPAFGSFTGSSVVHPRPGDRVFVVGPGGTAEVPVPGDPRRRRGVHPSRTPSSPPAPQGP